MNSMNYAILRRLPPLNQIVQPPVFMPLPINTYKQFFGENWDGYII